MKNIFKKISLLSSAALLALGLSAPMASARVPGIDDLGIRYDQVSIGKGLLSWLPHFILATGLKYTGVPQKLITGLDTTDYAQIPAGATLYVRVADSQSSAPTSANDWVAYSDDTSFANEVLMRTVPGTYHIYWYLDGRANNDDIASLPEQQP